MKRKRSIVFICVLLLASFSLLCACAQKEEKTKVRVLIVPKFEIGEMSGDAAGEAQLFYEHYCPGCEEIAIPNTTPTSQFYFNKENGHTGRCLVRPFFFCLIPFEDCFSHIEAGSG